MDHLGKGEELTHLVLKKSMNRVLDLLFQVIRGGKRKDKRLYFCLVYLKIFFLFSSIYFSGSSWEEKTQRQSPTHCSQTHRHTPAPQTWHAFINSLRGCLKGWIFWCQEGVQSFITRYIQSVCVCVSVRYVCVWVCFTGTPHELVMKQSHRMGVWVNHSSSDFTLLKLCARVHVHGHARNLSSPLISE